MKKLSKPWQSDPDVIVREDGRLERICKHGIGHCIGHVDMKKWMKWMAIHGCDGCCSTYEVMYDDG